MSTKSERIARPPAPELVPCPRCKNGVMEYTVIEGGKSTAHTMQCIDCGGSGKITKAHAANIEHQKTLWCECEEPGNGTYVDDGESSVCYKHHYVCSKCGKIQQIG